MESHILKEFAKFLICLGCGRTYDTFSDMVDHLHQHINNVQYNRESTQKRKFDKLDKESMGCHQYGALKRMATAGQLNALSESSEKYKIPDWFLKTPKVKRENKRQDIVIEEMNRHNIPGLFESSCDESEDDGQKSEMDGKKKGRFRRTKKERNIKKADEGVMEKEVKRKSRKRKLTEPDHSPHENTEAFPSQPSASQPQGQDQVSSFFDDKTGLFTPQIKKAKVKSKHLNINVKGKPEEVDLLDRKLKERKRFMKFVGKKSTNLSVLNGVFEEKTEENFTFVSKSFESPTFDITNDDHFDHMLANWSVIHHALVTTGQVYE